MKPDVSRPPLGYVLTRIPIGLAQALLVTVVARDLWQWFITPVVGTAVPTFWLMLGLLSTVRYLLLPRPAPPPRDEPWDERIAGDIFTSPLSALLAS